MKKCLMYPTIQLDHIAIDMEFTKITLSRAAWKQAEGAETRGIPKGR